MLRFVRPATPWLPLGLAVLLSGCGGAPPQVTYTVTGTATEAFVSTAIAAGGALSGQRVTLPWTMSFDPDETGAFVVYAVDVDGAGTVTCRVTRGDAELAAANGETIAGCTGSFSDDGGLRTQIATFDDVWPDDYVLPPVALPAGEPGPILYTAEEGVNRDHYAFDPGAQQVPARLISGYLGTCLRWSPDGTRIAFMREDEPAGLHVVNIDGTGLTLVDDTLNHDLCAAWSPDGTELAFGGWRGTFADIEPHQIFVARVDGSGVRQITNNLDEEVRLTDPSWSPDGTRIAYVSTAPDPERTNPLQPFDDRIFAVNADGTEPLLVSDPERLVRDLAWAPTGDRLLYVCHDGTDAIGAGLCLVGIDGVGTTRLTDAAFGDIWQASWTADGTMIVFLGSRGGQRGIYALGIEGLLPFLVMPVDPAIIDVWNGVATYPGLAVPFRVPATPAENPFGG